MMTKDSKPNPFLQAALRYGSAGLKIFPTLEMTKDQPLITQWGVRASSDAKQITAWWTRWPNANIGLACMPSGFAVIDSDMPDGEETLTNLDALEGKSLSPTRMQRTPSGGIHRFYRGRVATTVGKIGPKVDTRGVGSTNGGYVLLPPSCTAVGKYEWTNKLNVAPIDPWVVETCGASIDNGPAEQEPLVEWDLPENVARARDYLTKDAPLSKQGAGGDDTIVKRVVPVLKDIGISEELAGELMAELWNSRCEPPWSIGGGGRDDMLLKIHNGYLYCRDNRPGINTAEADFAADPLDALTPKEARESEIALARNKDREATSVTHKDFLLYLPKDMFICIPQGSNTNQLWPAKSVSNICPPIQGPQKTDKAKVKMTSEERIKHDGHDDTFEYDDDDKPVHEWLQAASVISRAPRQKVSCMTWWPGQQQVLYDVVFPENGGMFHKKGMHAFNRYIPPRIYICEADKKEPTIWLDHIKLLYPDDWWHIVQWLAHRVQHPETKILHALVTGGSTRIGKDTIFKPVKHAIGPWNFTMTDARTIMDEPKYNGYLEGVICLISEARDFGPDDRYGFYNRTMPWMGGTATGVLKVADKYVVSHPVIDVVGFIITVNHKARGLYLPEDDARHYVAWSNRTWEDWGFSTMEELKAKYFDPIYDWYDNGGNEAVVYFLRTLDLSGFDPTAVPLKTAAWHEIVAAHADKSESALSKILERLGNPPAVSVREVKAADAEHELEWYDQRGRNAVAADFDALSYALQQSDSKKGHWQVGPKTRRTDVTIYVRAKLDPKERVKAAVEVHKREHAHAMEAKHASKASQGDDIG